MEDGVVEQEEVDALLEIVPEQYLCELWLYFFSAFLLGTFLVIITFGINPTVIVTLGLMTAYMIAQVMLACSGTDIVEG